MTSITQDHDSGICHAASENRRKLLIQLKQLADEFENCHHEVRNDRGKLSQHKTSLEKECSGMNGNGKGIQQFTTYGNQIGNSNGNGKGAWCGSEKVNGRNKEGKQKFEILLQNNRHRHNCCGGQGFQKSTAQANQNGKFNGTGWCGAEKLNKETNGNNVKEFVEVIEMKYDNDGVRGGENSNKDITEYKDKYGEDIVDRNLGVIKDRDDVFNKLRHYVMKLEEVPENGAWCGSEKVNGSEKEGKRSFELVKNVEELKDGKKGTWCGVDGLNRNGKRKNGVWAEEMRMKEMHECGGRNFGVEGERSKERNGNDDAYHNRQNEINEMLEKFGGRNCCVKDDNAKKHGIEMILKKLETARDRCNDFQVGQRQNGSTKVGQRGNNNCVLVQISDRVGPNCDKVRPLFQNCRPGCGYKDQPLITFPEYPTKPDYKLTKPTTKCDNERGQLSGGVLESCECTKRNGLQDQCRSHCHETESGNKLTVDC